MVHPMLWEQSIHHFDLLRFVYGAEPVAVYARTFNPSWSMYEGDANVSALFTFSGG
jgi:predicted dehydrogenase